MFRSLSYPILLLTALLITTLASAQDVSIRVQVNRLPDGHYPTKVYQFNTTPGLVLITLTNLTQSPRTLYLTGKLTGDNGVLVITPPNFRPPTTIDLPPLTTKTLNAIEASYLFDVNNLVYLNGNTSIKSSVFGEQGLPEGTYQLCLRAIDAASRQPISEEEPIGCSNIFQVSTLEPPMILNPYDEQPIQVLPVQTLPIRWTTPPGAPPSTEYTIRIVEVFGQRNPYDAILSTPTPFFETIVRGAPLFLYSVQQPQLQEGRTYAMIVTASDPAGGGTFRNGGHSEVVQFTYGGPNSGAGQGNQQGNNSSNQPPLEYADHTLTGRFSWAFKKSETAPFALYNNDKVQFELPKQTVQNSSKEPSPLNNSKEPDPLVKSVLSNPYLASTVSLSAFAQQTAITPLLSLNPIAAVNADPSLQNPANNQLIKAVNTPITLPLPDGIVTGSGATVTSNSYETIVVDSATERFPLAGVSVTLKAITTGSSGNPILLATGQTDKDGNFTLQFLDPSYSSGKNATRLILSASSPDFENSSMDVPLSILTGATADIGNRTLLAKTLRLYPKIDFDAETADNENGYGIHIYRDISEQQSRPWLINEGQIGDSKHPLVLVDGRQMVEIASDSIAPATVNTNSKLRTIATLDAKGGGRIFFGGNIYVKIIPSSSGYYNIGSYVNIINAPIPSNKVLLAKVEYRLNHKPSQVSGTVSFPMGTQGRIPIAGAQVRVLYSKGAAVAGNVPPPAFGMTAQAKLPITGVTTSGSSSGSVQNAVSKYASLGLYIPLLAQPASSTPAPSNGTGTGNQNIKLTAAVDLNTYKIDLNPVPDDSSAVTTTTDELGNYTCILPRLKDKTVVTVEVINTPADFRNFLIEAQGYGVPKPGIILDSGASKTVGFDIKGDVADVVGRIVDDQGKPLANARIDFKGGTLGATGPDGLFEFSIYPGKHTITLEKEGYVIKDITINVPQLTKGSQDEGYSNKWLTMTVDQKKTATLTRISSSETVQASILRGSTFSATMFGFAAGSAPAAGTAVTPTPTPVTPTPAPSGPGKGITALATNNLAAAFGIATASPGSQYETPREFALDLKDIGYLNKIVGKARFRVVEDGTNNPIANATITVFDSTHTTDDKGEWYYEGFGGAATLTLLPPKGTQYIALQKSLTLAETGKEQVIVLTLQKGILISGTVSSNGQPLPNTRIVLDDLDFSGITTDAGGHYNVYTSPGAHKVGARKSGYVGSDVEPGALSANKTIDFILTGGNGRNYATLLGFAIELDQTNPAGPGQEKWRGNFVQLKPVDATVFSITGTTRIPFSNLLVSFDGSGNAQPANNLVKTDLTELPIKLFGYLPVKLTGTDVVTFTKAADGHGQLSGRINIAFNAIQGYRGWSITGSNATLTKTGSTTAVDLVLLSSNGEQPTDHNYSIATSGSINGQLYGFNIALSTASITTDGVEFTGKITTPTINPIEPLSIPLTKLSINRALSVGAVLLQTDNLPKLKIASWEAALQNLIFNEDGFKVGGSLTLNLIHSKVSLVDFSNLTIGKTSIFGGSFNLPDAGVDLLNMANLNSNHTPLTFGQVGTSSVFHLTGKASMRIDIPILTVPLELPAFEIFTNGDFSVTTPQNRTLPLGPFSFTLTNLIINSKDNTPTITIQGKFVTDFVWLKFEIADINIRPIGGKPVFSVGKVGATLDVPVVKTSVTVGFSNDGFEGEGSLEIPGTPIGGKIGFKYYKHPEGIELGANFFVNLPPIPIGGPVTLEGIGGGFSYTAGGPNGGFSVDVQGKVSMLGTGALVALNPVGIHVESAGILKGYGDMEFASFLKQGHSEIIFNGPDRTFSVDINQNASPIQGLVSETIEGTLVISAKKGDEFAFIGCATHVKLLDLINNNGEMCAGIGVRNPRTRNDGVSHYFENVPENYVQNVFSGVLLGVDSHIGIGKDDALGFDLFVVSAKAWFEYGYHANLLLNFAENGYHIGFGGGFSMGVEACVLDIACIEISASMCINVDGGRNNTDGWNFAAKATGSASLGFGIGFGDCDPGCNEVVTFWDGCVGGAFKVCGNASVELRFTERGGLHFSASAGGNDTPCM